jgi:hypothetical protein
MKSNRQNEQIGRREKRPDGLRRAAMTKEHKADEEHLSALINTKRLRGERSREDARIDANG